MRENFRSLHRRRHIDFPELPAHPRALSSPVTHTLTRCLTFHRLSDVRASHRVAHRRASGVSAGCYFKSCQSLVIAPVFQHGLNRTSSSQVRRKVNMPESRSRGNVVWLNEKTTNVYIVHRPLCHPLIRWVCSNFSHPTFSCGAFDIRFVFFFGNCFIWHYVQIYFRLLTGYSYLHTVVRDTISSTKFWYRGNF